MIDLHVYITKEHLLVKRFTSYEYIYELLYVGKFVNEYYTNDPTPGARRTQSTAREPLRLYLARSLLPPRMQYGAARDDEDGHASERKPQASAAPCRKTQTDTCRNRRALPSRYAPPARPRPALAHVLP